MGGMNSGRRRTRRVGDAESFPRLDIKELKRRGAIVRGSATYQVFSWSKPFTGEHVGQCLVTTDLRNEAAPRIVITSPAVGSASQTVVIAAEPMRYGGERFYFVCPVLSLRCEVLINVSGIFASRQASRVSYRSSNAGEMARLSSAVAMLHKRLEAPDGGRKPRGEHKRALQKRLLQVEEARDRAVETRFAPYLALRQRLAAELRELETSGLESVWPWSQS